LVLGDDRAATDLVQALAARIPGVRGVYGGRLRNCRQVESLTANLVSINRRYKAQAGKPRGNPIRIINVTAIKSCRAPLDGTLLLAPLKAKTPM